MNKKLDRLKQWSKERMGGEIKTDTSDHFKALEVEMQLRQEGMEKLKKSTDVYTRWLSKRDRYVDKEPQLPVGYFGSAMVSHGDDFVADSEFGQCLSMLGRANERIARMQETYTANATHSWSESLERSLGQLKEYQVARKKLESRRLAYDAASGKVQKLKREDSRVEEELRSQQVKYEESSEDVYRRMVDIKDAEIDSVGDLTSFLEAELAFHDRCRDVLLQLKREWPATPRAAANSTIATSTLPNRSRVTSQTQSQSTSESESDSDSTASPLALPRTRQAPATRVLPTRRVSASAASSRTESDEAYGDGYGYERASNAAGRRAQRAPPMMPVGVERKAAPAPRRRVTTGS